MSLEENINENKRTDKTSTGKIKINEAKMDLRQDIEESQFILLKKAIKENTGFNCEKYKEAHFRRRLNVRMRATGTECYGKYLNLLEKDTKEYQSLIKTLTINVSEFFRNPETFEVIEKEVFPLLIKSKFNLPIKTIRIWSAGCASGEEAYSLAVLLHKVLGKEFEDYKISILGSDIDDLSLEKARKGFYSKDSLKNLNQGTKESYFTKHGEIYQIIDQLKNITYFEHHDMISGPLISDFDLIICRNVTIYFKKEIQEQLQLTFYQALNESGIYIIGKAETLLGTASNYFKPYNSRERIYLKIN